MTSENPIQLIAFEDMLSTSIEDFLAISTELGEPLIEMGFLVKDAFDKCRDLIGYGLYNEAPADEASFFAQQPLASAIRAIQDFREQNRTNAEFFNHLSTVSESILALSWITIKPAPTQFIRDMKDSGQYFGNRVLASFRGNANHANWINKWNQILKDLELYVKQYFICGFTWGSAQGGLVQPNPLSGLPLLSTGPIRPPPPPPIPSPPLRHQMPPGVGTIAGEGPRNALLHDLNQGTAITNRLRHVNRDAPRAAAPPAAAQPVANRAPRQAALRAEHPANPPIFILEGRKWTVAHQRNRPDMKLENDDISQSLQMFNCENSTLEIENKINNVVIDNCRRVNIIVKDVIASVEVIRCDRLKIQCEGIVPLINLSNSDSVQMFVNDHSRNVEIIASKSSSLNVCLVRPDGDYVEFPVPEQIRSVISLADRLTSTVVENI